jgi:hypothetical protein
VVTVRIDRPREGDDEPDSPARHARREPDRPVPAEAPVDRAEVFAEYKKAVEIEYRAYAIDQGCDRVREVEETVTTPAMKRIEAEDPTRHLVGFEHRLKGRERLTEKVTNWLDADPNLTPDQAFSLVKDAIRYTFQYSDDRYAKGVHDDCERLKAASFELVELRNSWSNEEYKGINSRWRVPGTDQLFEVQFHTEASFAAKQETHPAYEKLRDPACSEIEQEKATQFQREVTARIPYPRGAQEISNYP